MYYAQIPDGFEGFLPGAEVKKKGALNAGIRKCHILTFIYQTRNELNTSIVDQQAALQWIQKFVSILLNFCSTLYTILSFQIHLFGGDASRVTIWGESAGELYRFINQTFLSVI